MSISRRLGVGAFEKAPKRRVIAAAIAESDRNIEALARELNDLGVDVEATVSLPFHHPVVTEDAVNSAAIFAAGNLREQQQQAQLQIDLQQQQMQMQQMQMHMM